MTILLAPNAFKRNVDAVGVAEAWRAGLAARGSGPRALVRPLSDGGDGFLAVVRYYRPRILEVRSLVRDPLGRSAAAAWGWDPGARAATIESAAAVGLHLVARPDRRPLEATTAGLGGLLRAAAALGVRRMAVGLGGSATVDGGLGLGLALGYRFLDRRGREIRRPGDLARLARVVPPDRITRRGSARSGLPLAGVRVTALADVDNPLLGPAGAAAVFGPQKGAGPREVERLEAGLARLAERWAEDLGAPAGLAEARGSGAAGGLGAALVAFAGARLERGPAWCGRLAAFAPALATASAVLTGEGRFDSQSEDGNKTTGWVVERALRAGVPVAVACGSAEPEAAGRLRARGVPVVDGAAAGLGGGRLDREGLGALARAAVDALAASSR